MFKQLFLGLLLCCCTFVKTQAQDRWLFWKYKDFDGSMSFTVPYWAIHTGSLFLNKKDDRQLLRRVHKVRIMVFQEGTPVSQRDLRRFNRKARRNHLEEIITVREGKTRVQIMAKDRGKTLRKVVIFVNDPEEGFFMVSMRGKLRMSDVNKAIKRLNDKDSDQKKKIPSIPEMAKLPTNRV